MITSQWVRELILPRIEGSDIEVLDIKLRPIRGRVKITFTIDHRYRGIMLDECAAWSRRFEDVFDSAPDFPRKYALDVSSPGLNQPLIHIWQFRKNIGRTLNIVVRSEDDESFQTGVPKPKNSSVNPKKPSNITRKIELKAVEDNAILVDSDERIPLWNIIEARVILPW